MQVKTSEYNAVKAQMNALARKAGGSLAVRDIASLVKQQDVVDSENLMTLFVVVSKFGLKEWESGYEKLSNFVVPRSSKVGGRGRGGRAEVGDSVGGCRGAAGTLLASCMQGAQGLSGEPGPALSGPTPSAPGGAT
jgi:hypothetical protein